MADNPRDSQDTLDTDPTGLVKSDTDPAPPPHVEPVPEIPQSAEKRPELGDLADGFPKRDVRTPHGSLDP